MNLKNMKILLFVVVVLIFSRYVRSQYTKNVTYIYDINNSIIPVFDTDYSDEKHRIADGKNAKLGDFPYMAVVHRLLGDGFVAKCGGTILSKRWILTSGLCIGNYPSSRFFVVVGIIDKSGIGYDELQGPGIGMITTTSILHPEYDFSHNDIALLFMPCDIVFSDTIQPVTLTRYTYENFEEEALIIGWGTMARRGTMNLKYAALAIISNHECSLYWHNIIDKQMCAAAGLESDTCQGDSGGPLVVRRNGQHIQVGIVSYGDIYCPSNLPGVFTRISSYIDWIYNITNI